VLSTKADSCQVKEKKSIVLIQNRLSGEDIYAVSKDEQSFETALKRFLSPNGVMVE